MGSFGIAAGSSKPQIASIACKRSNAPLHIPPPTKFQFLAYATFFGPEHFAVHFAFIFLSNYFQSFIVVLLTITFILILFIVSFHKFLCNIYFFLFPFLVVP
jgi:hypothetical protein